MSEQDAPSVSRRISGGDGFFLATDQGGVTAPNGFQAAGIVAGLKPSGKPDLALLLAPEAAVCAGTFTTSVVRAACVDLCCDRLVSTGGQARAVLINSGQANAWYRGSRSGRQPACHSSACGSARLGCGVGDLLHGRDRCADSDDDLVGWIGSFGGGLG